MCQCAPTPLSVLLSLQDLAWLMEAHRKELADAHRKNQDLVTQVRQQSLRAGDRAGEGGGCTKTGEDVKHAA